MGVVRKSIQITRAVKSVGRLRQIVTVLSRHGFGDVIERLQLSSYMPKGFMRWTEAGTGKSVGLRLRESLEELGPTFVKLGQVLSMRPDLVPEAIVDELVKLQDNVQSLPFETIKAKIELELKQPLTTAFRSFNPVPLAAGSIGQVHDAVLLTGEEVVVKVLRPDIRKVIETDIGLLTFLAETFEKYFPELRILNPRIFVEEFFKALQFELDFKIEANNISKIAKNLADFTEIRTPKVYKQYSTHEVLVLEKFVGVRLNDKEGILSSDIDRKKIAEVGAKAFLYSVLKYGVFHGDLHGGNLFVLPGNQLGLIDFGIVGRLSQKSRDQLAMMVWALIQEDYETLCYTYAELGSADTSIDFDSFQREVRSVLSPYLGLSIDEVNTGRVLIEATKVAARYNIRVPGDWMLVFRAIVTMEGLGRLLDPEFDMIKVGESLVLDLVKIQTSMTRIKSDAFKISKDLMSLADVVPRNIRWALQKFARNDYAVEIKSPDLARLARVTEIGQRRVSSALLGGGALIAGSIVIHSDRGHHWGEYPALGLALIALGLIVSLRKQR
jgi:ubiquinone biosynthesis protein